MDIDNAGTEMTAKLPSGVPQASGDIRPEPVFDVDSCGDSVALIAGLPLETNIQSLTITAAKMPYIGGE